MRNRQSHGEEHLAAQKRDSEGTSADNPARRRLITASASSALATAALASGWIRPVVKPALLPAHAQTTATAMGIVRWAYNNVSTLDSALPANAFASAGSPCGSVTGHVQVGPEEGLAGSSTLVVIPCTLFDPNTEVGGGPYEVVSWLVNGIDVGAGSGVIVTPPVGISNTAPWCPEFLDLFAAAMQSLDPEGEWTREASGGPGPLQGGCGNFWASSPQPEDKTYGPLQIRETAPTVDGEQRTWTLFPIVV